MRRRRKMNKSQRHALALLLLSQKRYLKDPSKLNARIMKSHAKNALALDAMRVYEDS